MKNKGAHWPYTIIALIVFMIIACVITVIQSLDFPVEDDYSYFDRYQNVENNYNEIQKSQEEFLSIFEPIVQNDSLLELKNSTKKAYVVDDKLGIYIKQLDDISTDNIKLKAMFVRPHISKQDFKPKITFAKDGMILVDTSSLDFGRWQLMIEYAYMDKKMFQRIEIFKLDNSHTNN